MKDIIDIINKPAVDTQEAIHVIEYYILKRTGKKVKIHNPIYANTRLIAHRDSQLISEAYVIASTFLLSLYYYKDQCTIKTY